MTDPRPRPSELLSRALSASAGLVALCALAVSAYQAVIMREQQKMSAWPRVAQGNTGGHEQYGRLVMNVGVGPAIVRSATLSYDSRPLHNWGDVLRVAVSSDGARLDSLVTRTNFVTSSVRRGMVLLPGSTTELVRVEGPLPKLMRRFFNDGHTRMVLCYCSVYNDCWISDSRSDEPDPSQVSSCPNDPGREFES